jgi:hypothetical protein
MFFIDRSPAGPAIFVMETVKLITLSDGTALSDAQVREYLVAKFPQLKDIFEVTSPQQAVDAAFNAMRFIVTNPDSRQWPPGDLADVVDLLRLQCHMASMVFT